MSILSFPRLYLRGLMSWDPVVSNNDPASYDGVAARAQLAPGESVRCFRERMIASTAQRGDWNYFGTHICALEDARVTGGVRGPGLPDDGLRDSPVELAGKLVDIDPTGVCSQLFFDEFSLGIPGRPHLRARPLRRMSSRWLNFGRSLAPLPIAGRASAAWQTVFAKADVEFGRATESPLLASLAAALDDPRSRGLVLRLCTYRTLYFQNGVLNDLAPVSDLDDLRRLHEQGLPVSNPAYSLVVGALGVWSDGEYESVPAGRTLLPAGAAPVRNAQGRLAAAGPAAAVFHPAAGVLSFDFGSTVPEVSEDVKKADFGPLAVVVTSGGNDVEIGRIEPSAYDKGVYEANAGIVDLDVSGHPDVAALLADGLLSVRADAPAGPVVLLAERELGASSDDCNVYLDEGDTRTLAIRVRQRGEPPSGALSVAVATYLQQPEGIVFSGEMTVLPVGADGTASFTIRAQEPGYRHYRFAAFAGNTVPTPPAALRIGTADFASVRTLPFDDALEAATPDEGLTFDFVYTTILSSYDAIAPRMTNILDIADAAAVRTFARRILEVTDPDLFESRRYMPVTRDLSRGRRTLLRRFCALQLDPPGPATVDARHAAAVVPDELRVTPVGEEFDKRALH
jgi:hypothetical protein